MHIQNANAELSGAGVLNIEDQFDCVDAANPEFFDVESKEPLIVSAELKVGMQVVDGEHKDGSGDVRVVRPPRRYGTFY